MLSEKKILLCVTGGIAVYKAAALTSKMVQAGAEVKVIMTASACEFVTPLTFQALSRNEVYTNTFDEKHPEVIAHIDLADWADLILVAPATANMIGKLANGIADDMISTTLLASTAPVWVAPAMNVHMYEHPAVKKNLATLADFGWQFVEPGEGFLACGYVGKGRLEEPEKIVDLMEKFFRQKEEQPFKNKKVMITAGPTREIIDPVRFLTNRSTGKMGYALAEAARDMGADVYLISGPVSITPPVGVEIKYVQSAEEMYEAVMERFANSDIVIKTAAVADYRPKLVHREKLKKQEGDLIIEMERTRDILKTLGQEKTHQMLIGFAAETTNIEEYARKKLKTKQADMIVANNVKLDGAGFGAETNIISIFKKDGTQKDFDLMTKKAAAREILLEAAVDLKKGEHACK
ncbi:bifunctional phosphopantothenoylcysteine decarboxylase/phosphopantothenate--cysteine ligase CoaBC [Bacillus sp. PK3_68]|uniref:bifunctional phosphopantothenoylcysteine decarboxylase/phosphopantothenate--cysteine ligase CoaBC n=1 Tax=Bacillus sp. PK3_68 TaxID=2027408 RepID=UPI000E70CBB4|nr:bifunctional phosphopantothenoylcysteine decarboxylase/phosphopantothenate--cysteine ligase CoaBC [Bacillus sp. PK3_68]RJS62134.1 bifunctional phosphopantothenoylcysteine decarboxylase/phosphopantothenate--cysteine ligase CoaBC [Bacillus sp. PK3_68]